MNTFDVGKVLRDPNRGGLSKDHHCGERTCNRHILEPQRRLCSRQHRSALMCHIATYRSCLSHSMLVISPSMNTMWDVSQRLGLIFCNQSGRSTIGSCTRPCGSIRAAALSYSCMNVQLHRSMSPYEIGHETQLQQTWNTWCVFMPSGSHACYLCRR